MFTNKLSIKFFLGVAALMIIMSSALTVSYINIAKKNIIADTKHHADSLAKNAAYNAEYGVLAKNYTVLDNLAKGLMEGKDIIQIRIFDAKDTLLTSLGSEEPPYYEAVSVIESATKADKPQVAAEEMLFFEAETHARKEVIGKLSLKVSLVEVNRQITGIIYVSVLTTVLVTAFALIIVIILINRMTKPLQLLAEATRNVSQGNLSHKVDVKSKDEIGMLSKAFNDMTSKLSETVVSKDYVNNIIQSMVDMLVVLDLDLNIKTVNQSLVKILGFEEVELIGQPVSKLFRSPQSPYYLTWLEYFLQNEAVSNIEELWLSKGKKQIPVLLAGSMIYGRNNAKEGIVLVAQDITPLKAAEKTLKDSEERHRNLVETVPDIIFSISSQDRKILTLNSAAEKLMGWKRDELIGKQYDVVVHKDDMMLAMSKTQQLVEKGGMLNFELRLLKKSGGYISGDLTMAVQYEDGVPAVFGIIRDITEKKKAEEEKAALTKQLLQSEKLAAVGQLAGGVAHEINNPLGVILGFSQVVMRSVKPEDPLFMPLQSIEREAKRSKNLVQDLLTFSRVGKAEKETCNFNEVIESALTLVEAQTKVKSVELSRDFKGDIAAIKINRNQIQQIIVNLSNNAVDAMPKGGKLKIKTYDMESGGQKYAVVEVIDNGSGIPADIQSKIYEPFFTTKEVGKGTGLGLALVYEIVHKHNGGIELQSEIDKGTTFKVMLPYGA